MLKQLRNRETKASVHYVESGEEMQMVKGVSKQIVEIVNTENEYFEKAILFINPDKSGLEGDELRKQADLFVDTYVPKKKLVLRSSKAKGVLVRNMVKVGCGVLGGALVSALLLLH